MRAWPPLWPLPPGLRAAVSEQEAIDGIILRAWLDRRHHGGPAAVFGLSLALGAAAALQRTTLHHTLSSAIGVAMWLAVPHRSL